MNQITSTELKKVMLDNPSKYTFIDVRSPAEFMNQSIQGFQNIPLNKLPRVTDDIDIEKPVIVLCASGARSGRACSFLESLGYQVINVLGGISQY